MNTDTQLWSDINDAFLWEQSIHAGEISVSVHDGIVTLTGSVPTLGDQVTAERIAQRVHGVRAVANGLEVRPDGEGVPTDTDIARMTADTLARRTSVPEGRIKIAVIKGWVTLKGDVDWHSQRVIAESVIRDLSGVRGVLNEIVVRPRPSVPEIKSLIEAAFRRHAEFNAATIGVEAHEGRVTLHGTLPSRAERLVAERMAWAAPGVSDVENLIEVARDEGVPCPAGDQRPAHERGEGRGTRGEGVPCPAGDQRPAPSPW